MYSYLIAISWIIFTLVWIFFGGEAKKNVPGKARKSSLIRLIIIIIFIFLFSTKSLRHLGAYHLFPFTPLVQSIGVLICITGIAFAIWARIHLGKNWGMPMSLKEEPELVTTGPYHLVRHPIYTGLSIAIFGSMVTGGFIWFIWFLLSCPYFIYSATKEEKIMLAQFPNEYPDYIKRTKMLIPFIF